MANILVTIETDIGKAWEWVKTETGTVSADIEKGLTALASVIVPIVEALEPTVMAGVKSAITKFLTAAESAGSLEDIEQDFIESLEAADSALLSAVQGLKGPILQALIALVKAAL